MCFFVFSFWVWFFRLFLVGRGYCCSVELFGFVEWCLYGIFLDVWLVIFIFFEFFSVGYGKWIYNCCNCLYVVYLKLFDYGFGLCINW